VQAASAGGIALLAGLVGRLSPRERVGVAVAVAGLFLLGLSLIRTSAPSGHGSWPAIAIWMGASLGVAAFAAGPVAPVGARGVARVAAFACVVVGAAALARPEAGEPAPAGPVSAID